MSRFKSLRYFLKSKKPKRVQNIKSLELAFDLPLGDYKPIQLLPVFFLVTQHLLCKVPKYNYTYFKEYENEKECKDGATNYNTTCYWNSFKKNNILNGYKPKRNTKGAATKAYLKKYRRVWHIRFEITFKTNDLDNMFYWWMIDVPAHIPEIFENLLQKEFKDFFSFANIDYRKFMVYANSHKNLFIEKFLDDLNEEAEFNTVADKLYYMRIMARLLHEDYLKNHIKAYIQTIEYGDFANFLKDYLPQ